ncbi:MAG: hypothetical protein PVJ08_05190 [Dehalococcoidia bacterium]|jgi:hypothetical protein
MTRAVVNPGVCGMTVTVEVTKASQRRAKIDITTDCEKVNGMAEALSEVSLLDALKRPIDSEVYRTASEYGLCVSCPVAMAILKAIEIENGLALPRPVTVKLETTD